MALLKNANTRNSAACTGLRAVMTPTAATTSTAANSVEEDFDDGHGAQRYRASAALSAAIIGFVALADREQLVLGHDVLAAILHVVLVDVRLDDRVDRAGFLAEAAVDALEQVDVVARRAARAVRARRRTRS